jgi:transposase
LKDNIEPLARMSERKVSQMMTGYFMGRKYGLFLPVYSDPESRGGGVTSRSLITVMEAYFLDIWNEIKRENGGEEVYLIIDNAKTHLPLKRWLQERGISLKSIPPYSPDLNPIEHIWALIKGRLDKLYPRLYEAQGRDVKKRIGDAITHCWELLKPEVFESLAESMVHRVQAVIDAEGWYTKY